MTELAIELTELEKLEVTRVDAVTRPANGFPALIMKGIAANAAKADGMTHPPFTGTHSHAHAANGAQGSDDTHEHSHSHDGDSDHGHSHAEKSRPSWHAAAAHLAKLAVAAPSLPRETLFKAVAADGSVDEQPDIDGGKQAIMLIGKLIGYEAAELAAGHFDEICDIQMLACAADALKCWLGLEQGADDAAGMLMQSAAKMLVTPIPGKGATSDDLAEAGRVLSEHFAAKADLSTAALNDLPDSAFAYIEEGGTKDESGKTTPRSKRHFAIHDKAHADNAAARIAQGAKFGDKASAKVKAAQKRFGEDTSKSRIAEDGTTVDTETQETGSLIAKAVEDAVTKATAPLQERIETLSGELAKVKATPVPGGPMMSAVAPRKAADGEDWAAKARYYRDMADTVSQDPQAADGYRQLARQAEDKAKQTT